MKKNKKILVTGGTGLVGSALKKFLPNAIFVSSTDCNLYDLDDTLRMLTAYKPDTVIHLAAEVGGLFKNMNDNEGMLNRNLIMNTNMIKSCLCENVKKFIGCLSTCIFPAQVQYPITEDMLHDGEPHESNYGYAYAKRMMEVQCRSIRDQYGYSYNCIIPTNIYGPHDNYSLKDGHVIPSLIHKAYLAQKNNTDFLVAGSGRPLRQFIYSEDLAKIISELIIMKSWESPIIIADKKEHSISEVASIIAEYFGISDRLVFDIQLSDGQYKKTADNSRLIKTVGEFTFLPIKEGLKKSVDWFIENYEQARK